MTDNTADRVDEILSNFWAWQTNRKNERGITFDEAKTAIITLIESERREAEINGRIAELWNPGLRIPENETVIRKRIAELEAHLNAEGGVE